MTERSTFLYILEMPIDFGWEHLDRVSDVLVAIAKDEIENDTRWGDETDLCTAGFLRRWKEAQQIMADPPFSPYFKHTGEYFSLRQAYVFWLPANGFDMSPGFMCKSSNNGTTYIVSPFPLSWLDYAED